MEGPEVLGKSPAEGQLSFSSHLLPPSQPLGAFLSHLGTLALETANNSGLVTTDRSRLFIKQLLKPKHRVTVYLLSLHVPNNPMQQLFLSPTVRKKKQQVGSTVHVQKQSIQLEKYEPGYLHSLFKKVKRDGVSRPLRQEQQVQRRPIPTENSLKTPVLVLSTCKHQTELCLSYTMSQVGFLSLAQDHNHHL